MIRLATRAFGALMTGLTAAFSQPEPLPAAPLASGVFWSVVAPAVLFAVALGATVMLYRRFAGRAR